MKGFTKVPNWLFGYPKLSLSAKFLYCLLLWHCMQKNDCFIGQKALADYMGISTRQVRSLLKRLKEEGLIDYERRGFNKTNLYTVSRQFTALRKLTSSQLYKGTSYDTGNDIPINKNKY